MGDDPCMRPYLNTPPHQHTNTPQRSKMNCASPSIINCIFDKNNVYLNYLPLPLLLFFQKVSVSMPAPTPHASAAESQSRFPAIHITYECVEQTRTRESETYSYELACSISYPATSAHLSLKITGLNTYRKAAAKEVPFTR